MVSVAFFKEKREVAVVRKAKRVNLLPEKENSSMNPDDSEEQRDHIS